MNAHISKLKKLLPEKRFLHSLRVSETAIELATLYGASLHQAELAGLLHDAAKYLNPHALWKEFSIPESPGSQECFTMYPSVWHSLYGPDFIAPYFKVTDLEVLNAIRWHTTGNQEMSLLSEILFVADYIEPGRDMLEVAYIRSLAFKNLQEAVYAISLIALKTLVDRGFLIHPNTLLGYNFYLKKIEYSHIIRHDLCLLNSNANAN